MPARPSAWRPRRGFDWQATRLDDALVRLPRPVPADVLLPAARTARALSLDLLNADSRLVKYLIEPPETVEEETPEWLRRQKKEDDEGGKGKRHKDEEGQMGKEEAKKTKNKYGIEGPEDNEDPHMAREEAKEQAANAGILGVLAGHVGAWNSPTSPYGQDTALGYDPMSALGALMGDQIGENFGFGGLGLRGTGRGGGGTGEGTIGLGNIGTIGHGGGGGTGSGYGRGAGGFRGRDAKVPSIRSGKADVRGSLSKEVIRRVIQRHINEVRFCYEQELNSASRLSGSRAGEVHHLADRRGAGRQRRELDAGQRQGRGLHREAVRRWTFPAPEGGGIVVVNYPFVLEQPAAEDLIDETLDVSLVSRAIALRLRCCCRSALAARAPASSR